MARRLEPSTIEVLTQVRLAPQWIALVLAGVAAEAAAATPRLICYPVMPGDTVTALSLRLTRDPQRWRGAAFQILDPAAARFVPKGDYRQLRPGWQACIVEPVLPGSAVPRSRGGVSGAIGGRVGTLVIVLLCSTALAALFALQWSIERRKATSRALEKFGAAFIREFERPLIDERSPRSALRAELALSPDRRAIEVLLAPTEGRRYPNLADHRTNVEYDVGRVVSLLNDRRFICGPLRARGSWVAIPFRLQPDLRKEEGGA
ncbi:MAG: hypothetical protein ABIS29_02930 [Vicinamibacterales bacterium]